MLEWLAGDMGFEETPSDYQDLEREDILATPVYGARPAHVNRVELLGA